MNIEPVMIFESVKPLKPVGITLSESAVTHIRQQLDDRSGHGSNETKGNGIRFGVKGAGCGGYSYTVEFVDVIDEEDHMFEQDNIKIFVDKKSILFIDGMEVNFTTNGFDSGLEFLNPLSGQACGCGESFTPKQ